MPAPTAPYAGVVAGRLDGGASELGVGAQREVTPTTEIEDHRRRDDRHDVLVVDREAQPAGFEPAHHPVGNGQPERAPAGEAHRVNLLDEMARVQRIGLARARPAAADVDTGDRSARDVDDRRPGQPSVADPPGVADEHAVHVGDRPESARRRSLRHRASAPDRSAAGPRSRHGGRRAGTSNAAARCSP